MPKEAVFTMKLENSLREGFIAAAKASHRPASQVMRELMREYIQRQNDRQAYDDWVVQKSSEDDNPSDQVKEQVTKTLKRCSRNAGQRWQVKCEGTLE